MTNYYELLQLSPNAEIPIVKAAYRTLMLNMNRHPDKGGSTDEAQKLNEAYAHLSDPVKKEAYDRKMKQTATDTDTVPDDRKTSDPLSTHPTMLLKKFAALEIDGYKRVEDHSAWNFDRAFATPFFLKNYLFVKACPQINASNIDGVIAMCRRSFSLQKRRWLPAGYYFIFLAEDIRDAALIKRKIEQFQNTAQGTMERFILIASAKEKSVHFFGKSPKHHPEDIRQLKNLLF